MIKLGLTLPAALAAALLIVGVLPTTGMAADCFDCHDRDDFRGRFVHAPLQGGDCGSCHDPHVSRHDGLLLDAQKDLCFGCHEDLAQSIGSKSVAHAPVRQGECSACHDPHAASHRNLLSGNLAQSCQACHATEQDDYAVQHAPYAQGRCSACHDPHAADDYRLIKGGDPELCLGCHTWRQQLQTTHMGRAPQSMACLECHDPHGGGQQSLLRQRQHQPFAEGDCRVCHAGSETGLTVCTQCHADVLASFNHTSNHLLGAGATNPCTRCHTPHAADRAGLLPGSPGSVCRDCHADTFARRQEMLHQHPDWQNCADCHSLHGSDHAYMLKAATDQTCGACHDRHTTFVHPIGDRAKDPRNGRPMDCVTCHDPNRGTMYQYNLRGSGERGLCIECHQGY